MVKFKFGYTVKGKISESYFSLILIEGSILRFRLHYIVERKLSKSFVTFTFTFIVFSI
jgi:hypothetical protein